MEKVRKMRKRADANTLPGHFCQKRIPVATMGVTNAPMMMARPPNAPPGKRVGNTKTDPAKMLDPRRHNRKGPMEPFFLIRNMTKYAKSKA